MGRAKAVGLDIGTSSVKVVELQQSSSGMELLHYAVLPLPAATLQNGVVMQPVEVADTIKRVMKTGRIKSKEVYVAVAGQSVVVRHVRFPSMTENEIRDAIQWEAEKHLPYSPEDAVIDFHIIGPAPEAEGEIDVMLVAAQNDLVNSHVSVLESAGLNPLVMDVQPFAILRSLGLEADNAFSCRGVIDIGAGTTDVVIFKGDNLKFTRIVPLAGLRFTQVLAEGLNCGFQEANDIKQQFGKVFFGDEPELNDPDNLPVRTYSILRPVLEELLLEVRRSVDYFKLQNRGDTIDELVLTGGGSRMPGLERLFSNELGIPVRVGNPLNGLKINPRQFDMVHLQTCAPMLSVGIGLAQRGVAEA